MKWKNWNIGRSIHESIFENHQKLIILEYKLEIKRFSIVHSLHLSQFSKFPIVNLCILQSPSALLFLPYPVVEYETNHNVQNIRGERCC